jgi:hypothetical protein
MQSNTLRRPSWWQWLLLLLIAACGTLLDRQFMRAYGGRPSIIISHALFNGMLVPCGLAYFLSHVGERSRGRFAHFLWWFSVSVFLVSVIHGNGDFRIQLGGPG